MIKFLNTPFKKCGTDEIKEILVWQRTLFWIIIAGTVCLFGMSVEPGGQFHNTILMSQTMLFLITFALWIVIEFILEVIYEQNTLYPLRHSGEGLVRLLVAWIALFFFAHPRIFITKGVMIYILIFCGITMCVLFFSNIPKCIVNGTFKKN